MGGSFLEGPLFQGAWWWQLNFYNLNMCGPLFKLLKSGFFGVITDWMLWLTWGVGPSLRNWAHATPLRFYGSYMVGECQFFYVKSTQRAVSGPLVESASVVKQLSQFYPAPNCLCISSSTLLSICSKGIPQTTFGLCLHSRTEMTDADSLIQQN